MKKRIISVLLAASLLLGDVAMVHGAGISGNPVTDTVISQEAGVSANEVSGVSSNNTTEGRKPGESQEEESSVLYRESITGQELQETVSQNDNEAHVMAEEIISKKEDETKETQTESVSENETETKITQEESLSSNTSETIRKEAEVSGNDAVQKEQKKFPGLEAGHTLSWKQQQEKKELRKHTSALEGLAEGKDFVSGEILITAADREMAEEYAKAFGGILEDFFFQTAVIRLPEKTENQEAVTVQEAVIASSMEEMDLPAAWPNYYHYPDQEEQQDPVQGTDQNQEQDTPQESQEDPLLLENRVGYQWFHSVIESKKAWEAGYKGQGVRVAVLDSGIGEGLTDISANTIEINETLGTVDIDGHGTHVAGIIGAKLNNQFAGAGVAPESEILSIKVLDDTGKAESADLIRGIQLAMEQNVDIINLSLGNGSYSQPEQEVITQAFNRGIAVICAAGNFSTNGSHYPAGYEGSISVAALDKNNHKASFTNYGEEVRYSAPGVEICSTVSGNMLAEISGTSQAAPVVSGTAAVLLSSGKVQGEGKERLDNLLKLMDESCIKVTGTGLGKGCVSLAKALDLAPVNEKPRLPELSLKAGTYPSAEVKVTVSAAYGSEVYYTLDGKNITYKSGIISEGAIKYNPESGILVTGKGTVTLKVIAVNPTNGLCSKVVTAKYKLKPVAANLEIFSEGGNNTIAVGKALTLKAILLPEYTADKKVQWALKEANSNITVKNGKVTVKRGCTPGEYTVVATAKAADGSFSGATGQFVIRVVETANPITSITLSPKSPAVFVGESISMNGIIKKKDRTEGALSELIWYSENSEVAIVELTEDQTLNLRGVKAGKTRIVGISGDGFGKKASFSVTVKQKAEEIIISGYDTLAVGKSITLKAEVKPADTADKKLDWKVTPETAKVKVNAKGKVTAARGAQPGDYTVTAAARDGSVSSNSFIVTVVDAPIKKLNLEASKLRLFRKENKFESPTMTEVAVITEGGDGKEWMVQSSNEKLLTVEKKENSFVAKATGTGTGTVTVTVTTTDGSNLKKTCKVTIENPATGLHLAPEKGRVSVIAKGKKLKLTGVLETGYGPLSAAGKKLQWVSSNPKAVSVDQKGNVKAIDPWYAEADIIARTTDGSNLYAIYHVSTCGVTAKIELDDLDGDNKFDNVINVGQSKGYFVDHYYVVDRNRVGAYGSMEYEYKVDKPGLSTVVQWQKVTVEGREMEIPFLYLIGNKKGNYKVTISSIDGSTAKRTYKFVVQ